MQALDDLKAQVLDLAQGKKWDEIRTLMEGLHYGDAAELISAVPSPIQEQLFSLVENDLKPDVLAELEDRAEQDVLKSLSNAELADIVEEMAPDDAADVLADIPNDRSEKVLNLMEEEESQDVRRLLKYDEESAGGIMTPDVVALRDNLTVSQAIEEIALLEDDEPFYYAYVVDQAGHLKGYIGLWELLKVRDRNRTLGAITHGEIISVTADTDQEEVAKVMAKYDLTAVPVVDAQGRLMGRVTVDDVLDVVEEEASEDIFRLAGSDDAELSYTSPLKASRIRLPWLLITLGTGFITSMVLKRFLVDFQHVIALAFFVPIVMAMGGNTGIQSSTLIIRSLALGALEGRRVLSILSREVAAGALMGVICGLIIGLWANFLITMEAGGAETISALYLAFTVGIALAAAMTFAAMFGAIVPIVLNRLNIDPAVASGPFVTSSNDVFALVIYYGVALGLLGIYITVN